MSLILKQLKKSLPIAVPPDLVSIDGALGEKLI